MTSRYLDNRRDRARTKPLPHELDALRLARKDGSIKLGGVEEDSPIAGRYARIMKKTVWTFLM